MAIDRREFLSIGLVSLTGPNYLLASPNPTALGTWLDKDGKHYVGFLNSRSSLPMPSRAHDIVVSADSSTAFVVARRPGRFIVKLDLQAWAIEEISWSPNGRHVCGHAVLSSDENILYLTENDYEAGIGQIGVYEVGPPLKRLGELPSYGVGPHDILRWSDREFLVVANGGIKTHPNSGTKKLNLESMASSIALIDPYDGYLLAQAYTPDEWQSISIRHMDISRNGLICLGMQWEGLGDSPALIATWNGSTQLAFVDGMSHEALSLAGYVGSIAFDKSASIIAATSPKGGVIAFWEASSLGPLGTLPLTDVCGLCAGNTERSFVATSGSGIILSITLGDKISASLLSDVTPLQTWDNHITQI